MMKINGKNFYWVAAAWHNFYHDYCRIVLLHRKGFFVKTFGNEAGYKIRITSLFMDEDMTEKKFTTLKRINLEDIIFDVLND